MNLMRIHETIRPLKNLTDFESTSKLTSVKRLKRLWLVAEKPQMENKLKPITPVKLALGSDRNKEDQAHTGRHLRS